MSLCQACSLGRHDLCDRNCGIHGGCKCPCKREADYANEAKREQADLAYKAMRENQ